MPEPSTAAFSGQIAYVEAGDIWQHDLQTAAAAQLTHDGRSRDPAWSPDGETLAFTRLATADDMQDDTIWAMRADGSEPQQLTGRGVNTSFPHYAPDGQLYYIEHTPGGGNRGAPGQGCRPARTSAAVPAPVK